MIPSSAQIKCKYVNVVYKKSIEKLGFNTILYGFTQRFIITFAGVLSAQEIEYLWNPENNKTFAWGNPNFVQTEQIHIYKYFKRKCINREINNMRR